jgi:hypothetical protein
MRRRDLLSLIGAAAASAPLVGRAGKSDNLAALRRWESKYPLCCKLAPTR